MTRNVKRRLFEANPEKLEQVLKAIKTENEEAVENFLARYEIVLESKNDNIEYKVESTVEFSGNNVPENLDNFN